MRWNGGDECDQQVVIYLQRKERGRQRKGSTAVGNSTDGIVRRGWTERRCVSEDGAEEDRRRREESES